MDNIEVAQNVISQSNLSCAIKNCSCEFFSTWYQWASWFVVTQGGRGIITNILE